MEEKSALVIPIKHNICQDHLAYPEVHSHTAGNSNPLSSSALGLGVTGMHRSSSPLPTATEYTRSLSSQARNTLCKNVIFNNMEEKEHVIALS